jgi:hypothetical protein
MTVMLARSIHITFIVTLLAPVFALGWSADGHKIIAYIATARLTPAASAQVKALLGDSSMADVASWADDIRREREETAPLHYVDIPVTATCYDPARDGNGGKNVIDAIGKYAAILADPIKPQADRVEALKFVIHFCGDIEQPLHCAERNGDKGGNTRLIFFLNAARARNLHSAWDTSIVHADMGMTLPPAFAKQLNDRISPKQAALWAKGTPTDWANESHQLAIDIAYDGVPADGPPPKLDEAYVDRAKKAVDVQFQRGGVRLAQLLNRILSTTPDSTAIPTPIATPTTVPDGQLGQPAEELKIITVQGGQRGGEATVSVQAMPGAQCSIAYTTPSGRKSTAAGLEDKSADANGNVTWSWLIGDRTKSGTGTISVTCGSAKASADIVIP